MNRNQRIALLEFSGVRIETTISKISNLGIEIAHHIFLGNPEITPEEIFENLTSAIDEMKILISLLDDV